MTPAVALPRPEVPGRIRVLHLITGTGIGGAEMMLFKLLSQMDRDSFTNVVYSMLEPGPMAEAIQKLGIEVRTLGLKQGHLDPWALFRFAREVRAWRPHILQTWMYHADLLGGLVGRLLTGVPVVWNIRHGDLQTTDNTPMTLRVARLCSALSGWVPDRIACCAQHSRAIHVGLGYTASKIVVIPNGFDTDSYRPCSNAIRLCAERFGIPETSKLISLVARYHPQKDHQTFFAAAQIFAQHYPDTVFALCGDGIESGHDEPIAMIHKAGLRDQILLLGRRPPQDIALLMSRSTVVTNSSSAEAFPNVVGEAMSCGAICVVTDVGDSAYIVGDTGIVVPPREPAALSAGWAKVFGMDASSRQLLQDAARLRIQTNFTIAAIAARYQNLYREVLA